MKTNIIINGDLKSKIEQRTNNGRSYDCLFIEMNDPDLLLVASVNDDLIKIDDKDVILEFKDDIQSLINGNVKDKVARIWVNKDLGIVCKHPAKPEMYLYTIKRNGDVIFESTSINPTLDAFKETGRKVQYSKVLIEIWSTQLSTNYTHRTLWKYVSGDK